MFSHSVGCLFILLMVFFAVQKLFSLMWCHLFIFSFVFLAPGDITEKILLWEMSEILLPMFSSRIFMVSSLTFHEHFCTSVCGYVFTSLRRKWIGHVVNVNVRLFSKWLYYFILPPEMWVPVALHLYLYLIWLVSLILAILVVNKWCFIWFQFAFLQITNDVEHAFVNYLAV